MEMNYKDWRAISNCVCKVTVNVALQKHHFNLQHQ